MVDFAKPPEGHLAFEEDGELFFVPQAQADNWLQSGLTPLSDEDLRKRALKKKYADSSVAPALLGAASGLSFGLAPSLLTEAGLLERGEAKAIEAANPALYTGADIGAGVLSVLLSGGTGAAARGTVEASKVGAKQIAKKVLAGAAAPTVKASEIAMGAGRAATKLIPGTGRAADAARTIAPLATAGALEGGLYGAGHAINEAVLKNPEWTAEDILASGYSGFGQGAAFGGAFGGALAGVGGLAAAGAKGMTDLVGKVYKNAVDSDLTESSVNFLAKALYGNEAERGGAISDVFLRSMRDADEVRKTLDDYNRVATQIADAKAQGKTISSELKEQQLKIRKEASDLSERIRNNQNVFEDARDDLKGRVNSIDESFTTELSGLLKSLGKEIDDAAKFAEVNQLELSRSPFRGKYGGEMPNMRQQFYVDAFGEERYKQSILGNSSAYESILNVPKQIQQATAEARGIIAAVDDEVLRNLSPKQQKDFERFKQIVDSVELRAEKQFAEFQERLIQNMDQIVTNRTTAARAAPSAEEMSGLYQDLNQLKQSMNKILYDGADFDAVLGTKINELRAVRDTLNNMSQDANVFPRKIVEFEKAINPLMSDVISLRRNLYMRKYTRQDPSKNLFGVFAREVDPKKLFRHLRERDDVAGQSRIELRDLDSYLSSIEKVEQEMINRGLKGTDQIEAIQSVRKARKTARDIQQLFDLRESVRSMSNVNKVADSIAQMDDLLAKEVNAEQAKIISEFADELGRLGSSADVIKGQKRLLEKFKSQARQKKNERDAQGGILEEKINRFEAEQDPSLRAMMDFRSKRPSSWEGFALADLIVDIPFVPDIVSGGILLASRPQAMMHTILGAQKVASVTANAIRAGANKTLKTITLGASVPSYTKKKSVLGHSLGKIAGISALPGQEPDLKNYDKSVERLNELTSNPEELENYLEDVGNTAQGMPTVKQNMIETTQRAIQYLQAIQPQPSMGGVFDPFPPEPTMDQKIKYATAISVINDPIGAYYYALGNNLLSEEVLAPLKAIYPQLATRLEGQVIDTFSEAKKPIPYSMRVQMALVYGPGMDLTVAPQFVGAMQQLYAPAGQEQQGGVNMTQGGVGKLSKSAAAYETPGQRMMGA